MTHDLRPVNTEKEPAASSIKMVVKDMNAVSVLEHLKRTLGWEMVLNRQYVCVCVCVVVDGSI